MVCSHWHRTCMANDIVEWLVSVLRTSNQTDRPLHLVVPGGTTPGPVLRALDGHVTEMPQVELSLTDERCVAHDDLRGNEAMVERLLPQVGLISLLDAERLVPAARCPTPDVALVGMGTDGHIASLFPGSSALPAAEGADACTLIAVRDAPDGVARVSRSYAGLIGRKGTALLISGAEKRQVIERVRSGEAVDLPVAKLIERVPDLEIFELYCNGRGAQVGNEAR